MLTVFVRTAGVSGKVSATISPSFRFSIGSRSVRTSSSPCTALGLALTGLLFTSIVPAGNVDIVDVSVIDVVRGHVIPHQTVTIRGERIEGIRPTTRAAPDASDSIVIGTGRFLIPGLWDMHVHRVNAAGVASLSHLFPVYLANGVTGIRDMFGPPNAREFRTQIDALHVDAPRLILASPIIDGDPPAWPTSMTVRTAKEARAAVTEQKRAGADFIKVYNRLSREAYFAIVDESNRQGITVAGHVPFAVSAREASLAGQVSIEHMRQIPLGCSSREADLQPKVVATTTGSERYALLLEAARSLDELKCRALAIILRQHHTWVVPTLSVGLSEWRAHDPAWMADPRLRYYDEAMRQRLSGAQSVMKEWSAEQFSNAREFASYQQRLVKLLSEAGVDLLAGTDAGNAFVFPGFSLHEELALLVESGLTPLQALRTATLNPARFMGSRADYGSITVGRKADLLVLDANPLSDIHNTTGIAAVILGGKVFERAALDAMLKDAETTIAGK